MTPEPFQVPRADAFGGDRADHEGAPQRRAPAAELDPEADKPRDQTPQMEPSRWATARIVHDINNALMVIRGYAESLTPQLPPGGTAAADVASIQRAVERASNLTQEILAFERRQALSPHSFDASKAVEEIGRMLRHVVSPDVTVRLCIESGGCISVDRTQFEQALLNLAINASDAMPQGGALCVRVREVEIVKPHHDIVELVSGRYCLLTITDTGTGMPPEIAREIFAPYFTTKGAGKGTGLGLAGVQAFVRRSGGAIRLNTRVGAGSAFRIYLPVASPEPESVNSGRTFDSPPRPR